MMSMEKRRKGKRRKGKVMKGVGMVCLVSIKEKENRVEKSVSEGKKGICIMGREEKRERERSKSLFLAY